MAILKYLESLFASVVGHLVAVEILPYKPLLAQTLGCTGHESVLSVQEPNRIGEGQCVLYLMSGEQDGLAV